MKRILSIAMCFLMVASLAAARQVAQQRLLNDRTGASISAKALTSGVAVYSEAINIKGNVGSDAILLIVEDKPGGAGDVDISAEYSNDGVTFYPAYTTNLAGVITVEGNIVTTLQNATRYITHTVRLGTYMRYKFDPDADSRITATFIFRNDN